MIESQNLGICVQPEFINFFKKSDSISTVNGKSHFLAHMPKKDKLRIRSLEEERKEFYKREKDVENQLVELKDKLKN